MKGEYEDQEVVASDKVFGVRKLWNIPQKLHCQMPR